MSPTVKTGHEILIPLFDSKAAGSPVTVTWKQNLSQRKADYYAMTADNITTSKSVPAVIYLQDI